MRVAVTGAGGQLGRAVVAELLAHGFSVVAVDRQKGAHGAAVSGLEYRQADLTDAAAARAALSGCAVLCHLAAIPNPRLADGPTVFHNNVACLYNVLDAAAALGMERAICTSSQSALGNPWAPALQPLDYLPVDELHPCRLFEPYGLSKLVGEQVGDLFARVTSLCLLSFRLPAVWHPDQHAQRIAGRLTDQLQAAKSLWAYVDVRDAARAYRLALDADWQGHEVVNISAAWAFGAAPVPALVARWYPGVTDIRVELEDATPLFDVRKAAQLLGFRAHHRWSRDGIASA